MTIPSQEQHRLLGLERFKSRPLLWLCVFEFIIFLRSTSRFFDGDAFFYFVNPLQNTGLKKILLSIDSARQYRPLTHLAFAYFFRPLFGLNPILYSLTAIAFHVLNTVLVFFILNKLLKNKPGAMAGATFWGFNPVAIYVTEGFAFLADFLYGFFFLLSILCFIRLVESGRWKFAFAAAVCFVFSLMSKEAAATLPAIMLVLYLAFLRPATTQRGKAVWTLLFLFLALCAYLIFFYELKGGRFYDQVPGQNYYFTLTYQSIAEKIPKVLPVLLLPLVNQLILPALLYLLVIPVLVLWFVFVLIRVIKGDSRILAGVFWFYITLSPVLFIAPSEFTHNVYIPAVGLAITIGIFVIEMPELLAGNKLIHRKYFYPYLVFILLFSLVVNQIVFLRTNWRPYYEKVAGNSVKDLMKAHARLEPNAILYILRSGESSLPWILYSGKLFNVFYNDSSIQTRFAESSPFPSKEADQGRQVVVLAYTDNHLIDVTQNYMDRLRNTTGYDLMQTYSEDRIGYATDDPSISSGERDTPNRKPVFIAPILRNGDFRESLVTIAYGKISLDVPTLPAGAKLSVGVTMKFDTGNGAEGRIYFDHDGARELLFKRYLNPAEKPSDRKWFDEIIDLGRFAGKSGVLTFECYPGPDEDSNADWFGWSNLRIIE